MLVRTWSSKSTGRGNKHRQVLRSTTSWAQKWAVRLQSNTLNSLLLHLEQRVDFQHGCEERAEWPRTFKEAPFRTGLLFKTTVRKQILHFLGPYLCWDVFWFPMMALELRDTVIGIGRRVQYFQALPWLTFDVRSIKFQETTLSPSSSWIKHHQDTNLDGRKVLWH